MKLYRYSTIDDDIGFLQEAYNYNGENDYVFDNKKDDIWKLTDIFEVELKAPDIRIPEGTKFYFTETGNRKFYEAIRELCDYLEVNEISEIFCTVIDEPNSGIIYRDTYQVAIYDKGSTTIPQGSRTQVSSKWEASRLSKYFERRKIEELDDDIV